MCRDLEMPPQILYIGKTRIFNIHVFLEKIFKNSFLIFAQNIDCRYTLERLAEYPQSLFWSKSKII